MSTDVRTVHVTRSPVPLDSFDSFDSSYSHRKLRSSLRERPSPPPPPPTMDKAIQCELKRCRKTVQEAARTQANAVTGANRVITKREYSDSKWAYSDRERRAQQSALASAYPNGVDLPDENVLDHRPTPIQFQYSKVTRHLPVSSLEQQVSQKRKVTNDYEQDLKFRLYAYKPGMDGKRHESQATIDSNNNHSNQTYPAPQQQVHSNRAGEVIYSQVDVSKKRSPKMAPTDSPLPDYSDHERRHANNREQATRPYLLNTTGNTNLRSRSASPARPPLSQTDRVNHGSSSERLRTYQFGFQSALTQPPLQPPTQSYTSSLTRKPTHDTQSSSKMWPDSSPLPSSSQPAPLASGNLLRQLSHDQQRPQSVQNNQVTYATLDRHRTSGLKSSARPSTAGHDERTAYTLDRRHFAGRTVESSPPIQSRTRSYALNRSGVSNSCNDLLQPPAHIAPSPPPPPPPPQFSDSPRSLPYSRGHGEPDYLQPRRCGSRMSVAYGAENSAGSLPSNIQRQSHSLSRPADPMPVARNRSPAGSVRKIPTFVPPRSIVTRSASLSNSAHRPMPRTASPSYSSSARAAPEVRPVSRSSTRSQVRVDQPIVVQLPPASALAHNRRLSASLAGGLNQLSSTNHGPSNASPASIVNRPSSLYRSSEQVNRLANRIGSSMSINQSPKLSASRTSLKSSAKPPIGYLSTSAGQALASSSSHLKRAQSIPKNAKLPLLQKLRSKLGKSSKE
jgi:hypothetical protein